MAKKLPYNGVQITTANLGTQWFFNRSEVFKSLGYSPAINYNGAQPLTIGNQQYIPFQVLQDALSAATGDRKKEALGLLQEIAEEFGIDLAVNKPGTRIEDLPGTAAAWGKALLECQVACELCREAERAEQELWEKLEKERGNG